MVLLLCLPSGSSPVPLSSGTRWGTVLSRQPAPYSPSFLSLCPSLYSPTVGRCLLEYKHSIFLGLVSNPQTPQPVSER